MDAEQAEEGPNLTPQIQRRDGPPPEVVRERELLTEKAAVDAERLRPGVEAHLETYRVALEALEGWHSLWMDKTDLDPTGDNRLSAVWMLCGRSIGLARALVTLASAGYCAELVPTGRSLHEANRLVLGFTEREGEAALKRWLKGQQVRAGAIRGVIENAEAKVAETARASGVDLPATVDLSRTIHGRLSQADHHDRPWVEDAVLPDLRLMAVGPHPDARRRAAYVQWAGSLVVETVGDIGVTLNDLWGMGLYEQSVKPLLQAIEAIREQYPLPGD